MVTDSLFQQTVFLAFFPEILARDAEHLGGFLNVPAAFCKDLTDVLALGALEGESARGGVFRGGSAGRGRLERRQVTGPEGGAVGKNHGALDDVAELTHIAGPVPAEQDLARVGTDTADVLLELAAEALQEVLGEDRD